MIDRQQISALAVIAMVGVTLTAAVGGVAGNEHEGYVVEQGEQCVPVAPITGTDTAEEFYDYRTTSTYTYSSHGTQEYQDNDSSILMLYEGSDGVSMVIVHDKLHENASEGTDGGSASFQVTNLPADGEWTVEDDEYDGRTDNFQHGETESELHWTWSEGRTDGAVFTGLGNDSRVQINASWNEDAKLWEAHNGTYNGTISDWQVITATETGDGFERHSLNDQNESVTVRAGSCDSDEPTDPSNASFAVSVTDINESVEQGETVEVTAQIENTGEIEGTQDIEFFFDGEVVSAEENVTLGSGENTTLTFTHDTTGVDPGEYDADVHSGDDADGRTVTVEEPPEASLAVSITDTNEPVEEGETLEVTAQIENTGEIEGTQDIEFFFDGEVVAVEENVTVGGGENTTLTFTHNTTVAGEYGADVRSEDDSDTRTVTVADPSKETFYAIEIVETNEPVEEGETLELTVEVENTGNATGTQDVAFLFDGQEVDAAENVTLDGGENTTLTFTYDTAGVTGDHEVEAQSEDHSDTRTVTVTDSSEEASFDVSITDTNDPVEQGETLDVTVEVENTGDATGTQDVEFWFDGEVVAVEENVTLGGGESTTLTFTGEDHIDTEDVDPGEYEIEVRSEDGSNSSVLQIVDSAEEAIFEVTNVETNAPITAGETVTTTIEVTNTGETTATKRVWFKLGEFLKDEKTVELAPGETKTVELSWDSGKSHADEWTHTAATEDDVQTSTVTIEEPSSSPANGDTSDDSSDDTSEDDTSDDTSETGSSDKSKGDDSSDDTSENDTSDESKGDKSDDEESDSSDESKEDKSDDEETESDESATSTPTETPASADGPTETPTADGSATTSEDEDDEATVAPDDTWTDESMPGFGLVPALVALLAIVGFLTSRRN